MLKSLMNKEKYYSSGVTKPLEDYKHSIKKSVVDFRNRGSFFVFDCMYCAMNETLPFFGAWLYQFKYWNVSVSFREITFGSLTIVLKRHITSFAELTGDELEELKSVSSKLESLLSERLSPDHFDYLIQRTKDYEDKGYIDHFHIHLVPRYSSKRTFLDKDYSDDLSKPLVVGEELGGFIHSVAVYLVGVEEWRSKFYFETGAPFPNILNRVVFKGSIEDGEKQINDLFKKFLKNPEDKIFKEEAENLHSYFFRNSIFDGYEEIYFDSEKLKKQVYLLDGVIHYADGTYKDEITLKEIEEVIF